MGNSAILPSHCPTNPPLLNSPNQLLHQSTIDIILSVIDNYGDIGFACELIASWRREIGDNTIFCIWTDAPDRVTSFIDKNHHLLGRLEIKNKNDFGKDRLSAITLALFHVDIPETSYFKKGSLILRVDYLSFDPSWTMHHLHEHIASTSDRQIIEIIPSLIPDSGGLIYPYNSSITRRAIAEKYDLDIDKNWIIIFAYSSTFQEIMSFDSIDSNNQILIFGSDKKYIQDNIIPMPWLDIATWHALIDQSRWALMRGEVSAVAGLMRDKLAFWDMYKMIGGFNPEQSEDYLTLIGANDDYRDLHNRLNGVKKGGIQFSELEIYIAKYSMPRIPNRECTKNLITEIKKCIDSHEFSI